MLQPALQIASADGTCGVTGRQFSEGEEFHTALFEDGDSFRRMDYGLESWTGPPEGCFCHFKTKMPVKEHRKRLLVDDDLIWVFFQRLATETQPIRVQFRFVLALILMRKRKLRYLRMTKDGEHEVWYMTYGKEQAEHQVVNPHLTDNQIEGVSLELTAILHGDMGRFAMEEGETAAADSDDRAPDGQPKGTQG